MNFDLNDPSVFQQVLTVIVTLGTGLIIWLANSLHNKYIKYRPKLFVTIERPLFSQFNKQHVIFEFGWRCTVTIKNKSKYTAYDVTGQFPIGHNISDKRDVREMFEKNNHLDVHEEVEFEVERKIFKKVEDILHITYEDNVRVFHPGTKIPTPEINLKPKEVEDIRFYIKYTNEFGRTFYTKYRKKDKKEKNSFPLVRPYLLYELQERIIRRFKKKRG